MSTAVVISTSHISEDKLFSEALSAMMAWGRTGWLEDFSSAAAAHSTSRTNTPSMTLGSNVENTRQRNNEGNILWVLEDKNNNVGESVQQARVKLRDSKFSTPFPCRICPAQLSFGQVAWHVIRERPDLSCDESRVCLSFSLLNLAPTGSLSPPSSPSQSA